MDRTTQADLYRYGGLSGIKGLISGLLFAPGFRYTYLLRKAARHKNSFLRGFLYRRLLAYYEYKYGFHISPETPIGEGFYLAHAGTVWVNVQSKIGKNCCLYHGVTLGRTRRGARKGSPTLGDNVWVGTNAVLVGNIRIGNNVLISPLSYVNTDVPDNSIVLAHRGIVVQNKENACDGYDDYLK